MLRQHVIFRRISNSRSLVAIPISEGMIPVKLFPDSADDNPSVATCHYWTVRERTVDEITKQKQLVMTSNSPKLESFPNDVGMLPDKALPKSERKSRLDKCPNSVGIVPSNWFDDASKATEHGGKRVA